LVNGDFLNYIYKDFIILDGQFFICDNKQIKSFLSIEFFKNKFFFFLFDLFFNKGYKNCPHVMDFYFEFVNKNLTDLDKNKEFIFHFNVFDKGVLINPYKLPLLNTIVLLTSGLTLTVSHKFLKMALYKRSKFLLFITICLSLCFIYCQIFEYSHAGFSMNDGIYGSLFYMLTGFHGFHVIIGTIFLIICLLRMFLHHITKTDHVSFECAI
jgi:heme/copper-type cytochrome/quinol oxidase subunit 3